MSPVPNGMRQFARAAVLSFFVTLSATSSSGQFPPQATYVCQTPAFWCVFQWGRGVPDGTPCYCGTMFGSVPGYSIDPGGVTNAPTLPPPQARTQETAPRPSPRRESEVAADDCYKGLGNCQGNFAMTAQTNASAARSSSSGGSTPTQPRTFTGTLAEGASKVFTLSLERGVSYRIKGECDRDCDDLDLKLRRGTTLVDDDIEPDDTPMVFVSPSVAATYFLEVVMESCAELRCSYRIEIEEN